MKTSEKRYAFLLRNITAVLMTFAATCALNAWLLLEINAIFLLAAALTADVLFAVLDHFKKKLMLWVTLAAAVIVAAVVLELAGISVRSLLREVSSWVREAFLWLEVFTESEESLRLPEPAYLLFFACLGTLGCMIVFYPLTIHTISRLILSALTLSAMIVLTVLGIEMGKFPLACIGICLVSSLIELVNMQLDRQRKESRRSAGLFLYPISVLLVVLAVLLPARETPIRWQPVRDLFNRISVNMESVETTLKIWFGAIPEKFTISFNGMSFTDEDGSVNVDDPSVLMYVSTSGMTKSPLYLRGNVSSTYTGTGWEDESESYFSEEEPEIELYELQYSMLRSGLTPESGEDLYKRSTVLVEFDDIVTKSLLYGAPLSDIEIETEDTRINYDAYGSNIRFQRMQKIGLIYSMTFIETNWGSPTLIEYLRSLTDFRYVDDNTDFDSLEITVGSAIRSLSTVVDTPDPVFFSEGIADRLAERARTIREVYTQLPESLPDRVYDLAREITDSCETTYDKILAIEDYFKDGYTYSLTPAAFPEDRDFVDWFLFDTNEGYCTYYATAATVLARCIGLPARYVEGVTVADTLRSRDVAEITNRSVHAWTEIYLEGYGWIPIEPTPGLGVGRNEAWALRMTGGGSAMPSIPEIPPEEPQEEMPQTEIEEGPSAAELAALEAQRREQMKRFWSITTAVAAGVIVVVLITVLLVTRRATVKRYNRASNNEKIRILMREILRCVASTGLHMREDETLLEYVRRAGMGFDSSDMKLSESAMLFMKVRYAEKDASRAEVLAMYRYTRELRRETLKQQNVLRRMYFAVRQYVQ